uniref:Toxin La-alphaKTx9 n=1 Tax=Liocheles australasiae TaxID=431266 RepID=KA319_LIOAU
MELKYLLVLLAVTCLVSCQDNSLLPSGSCSRTGICMESCAPFLYQPKYHRRCPAGYVCCTLIY